MLPTLKPALRRAALASAGSKPITFGTSANAGPVDTKILTSVPFATISPAAGLVANTRPLGESLAWRTIVGTMPADIAVVTASSPSPTSFGTATVGGPDETTTLTTLPGATAAVGDHRITPPCGIVVLSSVIGGVRIRRLSARNAPDAAS